MLAGYSRLMGTDEAGTLQAPKTIKAEVFGPTLSALLAQRAATAESVGPNTSAFMVLGAWRVPASSVPISREYLATSEARIVARRRVWFMSLRRPPNAGPLSRALDAPGCANAWHAARRRL